ncbi:MAG: hypothetical protein DRI61_07635 [Chloroflexi bacterium]|nr:MAG: hypothetical protein DRI61_07635 [Chloroflexota bacterium]
MGLAERSEASLLVIRSTEGRGLVKATEGSLDGVPEGASQGSGKTYLGLGKPARRAFAENLGCFGTAGWSGLFFPGVLVTVMGITAGCSNPGLRWWATLRSFSG